MHDLTTNINLTAYLDKPKYITQSKENRYPPSTPPANPEASLHIYPRGIREYLAFSSLGTLPLQRPKGLFPSTSNMEASRCIICNKADVQACSSCKAVKYCSKSCQKADWKSHKLLCKAFTEQPPRPSPSHYRAIFFDPAGTGPQLVWITHGRYTTPVIEGPAAAVWPDLEKDSHCMEKAWVIRNPRTGLPLPVMRMCCWEDFHRLPVNKSVLHAIKHYTDDPDLLLRGPILVYLKYEREACRSTYYPTKDVTLEHLRHIIDYIVWYRGTYQHIPSPTPPNAGSIRGENYSIREALGSEEYGL